MSIRDEIAAAASRRQAGAEGFCAVAQALKIAILVVTTGTSGIATRRSSKRLVHVEHQC